MLRVLVQNRADSETCPGGDTVQMEWTVRFLRERGYDVCLSFDSDLDLSGFDVVHLFNLTRPIETLAQAENARRQSKPMVLSSVYWDLASAVPWHAHPFPRNWYHLIRPRGPRSFALRGMQKMILQQAEFVFPNSEAEKAHLLDRFYGLSSERLRVVKNGVAPASAGSVVSNPLPLCRGAFVCAGAIGPRKNQLNLVRAFSRLPDERLCVIGQAAAGCAAYDRAVRRVAGANVSFHGTLPHAEMGAVLREARALVQPSYIETPGLSAMEAAAAGTPIVVADVGPVREYFGALAHYCDPSSPAGIAAACRAAIVGPRPDGAAFAEAFDWMGVLEPMGGAYAELEARIPA
ncbi:MAG: glycosyltransferase [Phycisphaerae bacterium]